MYKLKQAIKYLLSLFQQHKFKQAVKSGKLNGQLLIIMYHRVLPKSDARLQNEEPGMYVTPDTLDMHLSELKKYCSLIHIEDWLNLSQDNKLEDKVYCAITYDDGWADNYEFALPLLSKHQAPATVFLATNYIGSNTTFWPERLMALLNNYQSNAAHVNGFFSELSITVEPQKLISGDRDYFAHLIDGAKKMTDAEINNKLDLIQKEIDESQTTEMLSWEQVKELSQNDIRIGGHTRSHLRLNERASEQQTKEEVEGCASDILEKLGLKPTQFCYPNGDVSPLAKKVVSGAFDVAVTTEVGINQSNTDPLKLLRVGVHEDTSHTALKFTATLGKAI